MQGAAVKLQDFNFKIGDNQGLKKANDNMG